MRKVKEIEEKHEREAQENGLTLISHEKVKVTKLYRFNDCGHEKRLQPGHVRDGVIKCRICEESNYREICRKNGILIIAHNITSNPNDKLIRFEDCGHEKIATLSRCKTGNVMCTICQVKRLDEYAEINGCKFIAFAGKHGVYQLPCGHSDIYQHGNIKRGSFRCRICKESYTTKESFVYIFQIKTQDTEFIKIGFTGNLERRVRQLIVDGTQVEVLLSRKFETGRLAEAFELTLHRKFADYKLNYDLSKPVLKSGWTECYRQDVLVELTEYFNAPESLT